MKSFLYKNYNESLKSILSNLEAYPDYKHLLHNPTEAQIMCHTQEGYENPTDWKHHLKSICDTVQSDLSHPLQQNLVHISPVCDFNSVTKDIWNTEQRHIKFGTGFEWREFLFYITLAEYSNNDHKHRTRPPVTKTFACMNKKPRPHRVQLLKMILDAEISDKGFITFACLPEDKSMLNRVPPDLKTDLDEILKHQKDFDIVDQQTRTGLLFGLEEPGLVENYEPCAIDIVAETDIQYTVISEKCLRPILYGKPFVAIGNKHNYYLEQMGFELFTELFDYNFEHVLEYNHGGEYHSPQALQPVIDQLSHWCTVPPQDIVNLCKDKTEHNKSVLVKLLLNDNKLQELQDTYPEHQETWQSDQRVVDRALNFLKTDAEFSKFV